MALSIKKKEETIQLRVGNLILNVRPEPENEVAKANARIQKRVQPAFQQIRKTRRAAVNTAFKLTVNN